MSGRIGRIGDWNNNNNSGSGSSSRSGSRGIATLGGLGSGGAPPSSRSSRPKEDSDDDDDDEPENQGETYYAGGERSGVSVQGPADRSGPGRGTGDLVRNLLRQAEIGGQAQGPQARSTVFSGGGHTLGSDEVESTYVPDPTASEEDTLVRTITLWRQGFQIEDGELRRYDDPVNAQILSQLNAGTAPLHIVGAREGQPVEIHLKKRLNEDYVPPQGPRAFVGTGNRLGAPVPHAPSSESTSMPGGFPAGASSQPASGGDRESINTRFEVDQTQPTTSIQIRLADGTRLPVRMNLTHTVGDIRNFLNAARPENLTRPYTIGTTFPNRILDNDAETVEAAKLQNSVVVQRWA